MTDNPENIEGVFSIDIGGSVRETKANFGVVEKLERQLFKRPILSVLNGALNGDIYISDIVDVIDISLRANKDTRLTREEIGQEVTQKGAITYTEWYLKYLTYLITGDDSSEPDAVDLSKKK